MSRKFRWIEVNRDHAPKIPREFQVNAYPSLIVIGSKREKIYRFKSYMKPTEFMNHLQEGLKRFALYKSGETWDLRAPRPESICDEAMVQTLAAPTEDQPGGVAVLGGRLWTAQADKLYGINLKTGKVEQTIKMPRQVRGLSANRGMLFAVDYGWTAGKPIYVVDPGKGKVVREIITEANKKNKFMAASGICWADGKLLVLSRFNIIHEVDPESGVILSERKIPERGWKLGFDGKHLVTATHPNSKKGSMMFLDSESLSVVRRVPINYGIAALAAHDGGLWVMEHPVLGFDTEHKRVRLWPERMLIYQVRLPD